MVNRFPSVSTQTFPLLPWHGRGRAAPGSDMAHEVQEETSCHAMSQDQPRQCVCTRSRGSQNMALLGSDVTERKKDLDAGRQKRLQEC